MVEFFRMLNIFVAAYIGFVQAWPLSTEGLTEADRSKIQLLRQWIKNDLTLEHMKEDLYSLRWLSATDFQVPEALKLLKAHLVWRRENGIDSGLEENWQEMNARFPYDISGFDKAGRPVLVVSSWNTGDASVTDLIRYTAKMLEDADQQVWKLRKEGANVTQSNIIVDLTDWSMEDHNCIQCALIFKELSQTMQAHFPRAAERVVFINAPALFRTAFGFIQTFLNDKVNRSIKVFGSDRSEWEAYLMEYIQADTIPKSLMPRSEV